MTNNYILHQEVSKHNSKDDLWVILHGKVYDLTNFLSEHPGGQRIILKYGGTDATGEFSQIHPREIIDQFLSPDVCKGEIHPDSTLATVEKAETEEEKQVRLAREKMPNIQEMYNTFDFESVAKNVLKPEAWAYYSSGSDDEISMRENHNAFHRIWLKPRVMVDVKNIHMKTRMLGTEVSMPLYITGTALGKLGHPEGELVLTRAAAETNIIQMIPTLASCSFDEIVDAALATQTQWVQLYVNSDRNITKAFVQHAEKRGIRGLFVTVDAPQLGRREKDMRVKYSDEAPEEMEQKDVNRNEGAARYISTFIDPSLSWKDLPWLKSITNMPIILKGVQTSTDAILAFKNGCQGIVLSNHGGRQLDFAPSGIEILPEVMDVLHREEGFNANNFEVYVDGGIRRGSDIFKAIALGASGVGIGRPALFAMSTYGQAGVTRLIQLLQDELEMCMRLMGAPTVQHITRDMVDIRNLKDHFVANPMDHLSHSAYERMVPRGMLSKL
ncbi:FMN-dependent dehydrogenase-domain-containing protein [Phascolomyces articulosus]|uniref:L-lactate dehydrogenase (cytochrome) n=1 Tax=Phascolomyces articulosus TaxID=60185 RepID=A0AAD5JWQ7_9FUNG|nr:FMN-dependent dehydrogenase-domain-containing protein [Phascolomyces articulosus]